MTRPLHVCRHEAGHAVVALYLGVRVGHVRICDEIDPNLGHILGHTIFYPERRLALPYRVALAAGTAADLISRAEDHSTHDRQAVLDAGGLARDWSHLVGLAKNLLRGPLAKPWAAVAQALLERDLGPRRLRQIYRGALG